MLSENTTNTYTLRVGSCAGPRANPREICGEAGEVLHEVMEANGVDISVPCGGQGRCGACRVKFEGPKAMRVSAELKDVERQLLGSRAEPGTRLACQVILRPDMDGAEIKLL